MTATVTAAATASASVGAEPSAPDPHAAHASHAAEPLLQPLVSAFRRTLDALPSVRRVGDAEVEALVALARSDHAQGRHEDALRQFRLLLLYRPTDPRLLQGVGQCLRRLGRPAEAVAAFDALRLLDAAQPAHALSLAECQLLAHRRTQALRTLDGLLRRCAAEPGHEPVCQRAQALQRLLSSHAEEAALP